MRVSNWLMATAMMAGTASWASGQVGGTVKLDGKPPEMQQIDMSKEAKCVAQHSTPAEMETVVTDGKGGLANAVVSIVKGDDPLPDPTDKAAPPVIDQKGCQYHPHVLALQVGDAVIARNSDPFLHNIHTQPTANPSDNVGQPNIDPGHKLTATTTAEYIKVKCEVHPWMSAWIAVIDNPYFAVTDEHGQFTLPKGLTDGDYNVHVWHEKYGEQDGKVTVKDGKGTVDFTYKAQ